ncbi:MAG TPA: aminopeptidase P N-terminal domain-containing protein [Candidatus Eremiobacteraceae bacterium]|nr:aminopeptidase P N-terminal domain-containing protein [Candidatus Eremiobacteraceae bacterium]
MTEFDRRRKSFAEKMGDAVAVFPSSPAAYRTNDQDFDYRQDSDLYYLTGFEEPESLLVLAPGHKSEKSVLFVRPRNKEREIWEGRRSGPEGAVRDFHVDAAYPIEELGKRIGEFLETSDTLYYSIGANSRINDLITSELKRLSVARRRSDKGGLELKSPAPILHEMRMIKTAFDIEGMTRAVRVSGEGHIAAMRYARPGMSEYEIEAIVEFIFHSRGAQWPAYSSIVAGGANATILHYNSNRMRVADDALVLIDAGAEVDYYCGDITRTWPMAGKFSPEQRAVYELVLSANERGIDLCRPGVIYNTHVHDETVKVLVAGLIELGLLKGSLEENLESEKYKEFYMHRTGHYLGLDTHDVGFYKIDGQWRPLAQGMVVTIEPGLYIPGDSDVDPRWRGIGVRIEDDILITKDGCENLSDDVPKAVADVERVIAEGRATREPLLA